MRSLKIIIARARARSLYREDEYNKKKQVSKWISHASITIITNGCIQSPHQQPNPRMRKETKKNARLPGHICEVICDRTL
jgi:hypothetical protein